MSLPGRWFGLPLAALAACGVSASRPPQTSRVSSPLVPDAGAAVSPPKAQPAEQHVGAPPIACATDGDCNFADPCQPSRCVASPARPACSKPTAADGSCVCFEKKCALRPSGPRVAQRACKNTGDCDVDVTRAVCEPGAAPADELRPRYVGPTCGCDEADHRCHLHWFDPVACETTDDCWVDEKPLPHAIARPKRLRGRQFRGCVDGERVPACVDHQCTLDALKC